MEKIAVKELREALQGILELSIVLASAFKDGVQAQDALMIWQEIQSKPTVKIQLIAAFQGVSAIPVEAKDLSLEEGIDLTMTILTYVPRLIEALKK